MRTYKYLIAVLLIITPAVSIASINTNLSFGSRGQAVTDLQNLLISKGFLNGQASGGFYSLTKQAVVAYQASLGLPATGFVGLMTRAKINTGSISQTASVETSQTTQTSPAQTQTNLTSPTAITTINPTITMPAQTYSNSAGQSANTTSATPTTSFQELSPDLQAIINLQQKQLQEMAAQAQNQPLPPKESGTGMSQAVLDQLNQNLSQMTGQTVSLSNALVIPTCVEKPNLVFEPDRAIHSSNVTIIAIYDTGCPINPNTSWSFYDGNFSDYLSNTLSSGDWNFGKENNSNVNNVAFFSKTIQTSSTNFTMTVGNINKTATTN